MYDVNTDYDMDIDKTVKELNAMTWQNGTQSLVT